MFPADALCVTVFCLILISLMIYMDTNPRMCFLSVKVESFTQVLTENGSINISLCNFFLSHKRANLAYCTFLLRKLFTHCEHKDTITNTCLYE